MNALKHKAESLNVGAPAVDIEVLNMFAEIITYDILTKYQKQLEESEK